MNYKSIFSYIFKAIRKRIYLITGILIALLVFTFSLPKPLFNDPTCTVINDYQNQLLAAQIASDGQWRFSESDSVPEKFKQALIYFEDEYFYYHPGVNPISIFRALRQNFQAGKVVSGGSTLSAQVIRLSRKGKKRNVWQKVLEYFLAVRLEAGYSKNEILALYASHAPFGGNVVGIDAAAWRYFARQPNKLSWGEAATLAVLPNAPALIYPGKNHNILLKKRNRLLDKMYEHHVFDSTTCELAKFEPLPEKPKSLPQHTPHLLTRAIADGYQGKSIASTIHLDMQEQANRIVDKHYQVLSQNEILNAAALIIDVATGSAVAYVGNTQTKHKESGQQVDIVNAARSTGSTLKPFLYALMQKEGIILPQTLIADIPTHIAGYSPKNFDKEYDGAVHADNALARSLNIPAVRMLQDIGVERFHGVLKDLNISTITQPANHYGLSLILGGAEITLWELAGTYASMARVLNNFRPNGSKYNPSDYHPPHYMANEKYIKENLVENDVFGAGPIWLTFEALTEMHRPMEGANWQLFTSSKNIAWKTGTSFGHRDAWAVGVTPNYVVAVWVGNADGEGRSGLTGASTAAPIMFDLFKELPDGRWFYTPYDDLSALVVCTKSGYKASPLCEKTDTILVAANGLRTDLCPYHKLIHLSSDERYQVSSECYPVTDMVEKSWFVLPPVMEWYYRMKDPFYKALPPMHPSCSGNEKENMEVIYPKDHARIFIPMGFNAEQQKSIFEVAHRLPETQVHWHIDEVYIGTTSHIHKKEIFTSKGSHVLTLVDDFGEMLKLEFEVVER